MRTLVKYIYIYIYFIFLGNSNTLVNVKKKKKKKKKKTFSVKFTKIITVGNKVLITNKSEGIISQFLSLRRHCNFIIVREDVQLTPFFSFYIFLQISYHIVGSEIGQWRLE
jgi:hypothetical protein